MTPPADFPKVALFFITYNQRGVAVQTLQDALAQEYPASKLNMIVLDDGSTDGSYDALTRTTAAHRDRVQIIRGQHDSHYRSAALWNRCIAAAPDDTLVFVQVDDVRLKPDFVKRHATWHCSGQNLIVTGAKFEGPLETWELSACKRHVLAGADGSPAFDVPPTAVWGASLSYPRQLVKAACVRSSERPYDELMTGYGHHEVEFAIRLVKAGGRTVYDPSAGVFHRDHDPLIEARRGIDRSALTETHLERNARYVCAKHGFSELPRW